MRAGVAGGGVGAGSSGTYWRRLRSALRSAASGLVMEFEGRNPSYVPAWGPMGFIPACWSFWSRSPSILEFNAGPT